MHRLLDGQLRWLFSYSGSPAYALPTAVFTKFSSPVKLPTYIISSLFKLTIILVPLMLSHLLVRLPPLKITDRSFHYASTHLWNQLRASLRKPVSPHYAYLNPSLSSPLYSSTTPSLLHCKLNFISLVNPFSHRSLTIDTTD